MGRVSLIGAGPGDPGLITVAGMERLRVAEVVIYDALANPELMRQAPEDARFINAGKRAKDHTLTQDEINALLVEHARQGQRVVRLKGGDPYLFGRGAEELAFCAEHGVPCEVIAGVTSGVAAPATAGIPVTHRHTASTVTLITGHEDPTKPETMVDYAALAALIKAGGTACFYMGVRRLGLIRDTLVAHGLTATTPAALIQWGTLPGQRHVRSTLADLEQAVAEAGLASPAIIVVGSVCGIDLPGLDYFTNRPLFGQRVLVTRTRDQASGLAALLREQGAEVWEAPTIRIEDPASWDAIDRDLSQADQFDWLVLTSANAVARLRARLDHLKRDARALAGLRIAVVGEATADALRDRMGLRADFVPVQSNAEGLAQELVTATDLQGQRMLLLRGGLASPSLPEILNAAGAKVTEHTVYETRRIEALPEEVAQALRDGRVDWLTFTSGSTAKHLAELVDLMGEPQAQRLRCLKTASIGPITSKAMRALGLPVTVEAPSPSVRAVVQAMLKHLGSASQGAAS